MMKKSTVPCVNVRRRKKCEINFAFLKFNQPYFAGTYYLSNFCLTYKYKKTELQNYLLNCKINYHPIQKVSGKVWVFIV